jgi:hypothetical protein
MGAPHGEDEVYGQSTFCSEGSEESAGAIRCNPGGKRRRVDFCASRTSLCIRPHPFACMSERVDPPRRTVRGTGTLGDAARNGEIYPELSPHLL